MHFFDHYVSCTSAGSGSQNWFSPDDPERILTSRVYFKLSRDIDRLAVLYSNLIDSTYADGRHSHVNFVPGEWTIHSLRAGVTDRCMPEKLTDPKADIEVRFDGKALKRVMPGEIFATDPFELNAPKGSFVCLEMNFAGASIPCHTESLLPAFRREGGFWRSCTDMPFPSMLGTVRHNEIRIGFLGDSITQGIGTKPNSYEHLAAFVQQQLGSRCAVWNLGLGYGRAHDAALDGGWLFKARFNDIVCVCFGVNDLLQTGNAQQLKRDLEYIVRELRHGGSKVVLQTVPPFDYSPELREKWLDVNDFIRTAMVSEADKVFDTVPFLCRSIEEPYLSRYGAHPDEEGNAVWADALVPVLRTLF